MANTAGLKPPWAKGQSGNPHGRPKSKPITDALRVELKKRATDGKPGNQAQQLARRMVHLALTAKPFEAVAAAKLLWSYVEGQPVQPVAIDLARVIADLAAVHGLTEAEQAAAVAEAEAYLAEVAGAGR